MLREWIQSKKLEAEQRFAYLHKLRLRAFGVLLGLALAAIGILSMTTAPVWPIVVGAAAVAAITINKVASRLSRTVCIGCGQRIEHEPVGQYGVVCPKCGTVSAASDHHQPVTGEHIALGEDLSPLDDDEPQDA